MLELILSKSRLLLAPPELFAEVLAVVVELATWILSSMETFISELLKLKKSGSCSFSCSFSVGVCCGRAVFGSFERAVDPGVLVIVCVSIPLELEPGDGVVDVDEDAEESSELRERFEVENFFAVVAVLAATACCCIWKLENAAMAAECFFA